jgi:hypothetical protein
MSAKTRLNQLLLLVNAIETSKTTLSHTKEDITSSKEAAINIATAAQIEI